MPKYIIIGLGVIISVFLAMNSWSKLSDKTKNRISRVDDILKSISPISTLDRGYAIITDRKTKKIIKNANHLKIGKKIHVKLASSEIDSTVDKIYEK